MGFLHESAPLSWDESLPFLRFVREHGIEQFLSVLKKCGGVEADPFKWGDEVEHGLFQLVNDGRGKKGVQVILRSPEVLAELQSLEASLEAAGAKGQDTATWMPEYGSWMLESTPGVPMQGLRGIAELEHSLRLRRERLAAALRPGEVAPTVTCMPLFGTEGFCEPHADAQGPAAASLFVPDEVMFPHVRFPTLTKNIRQRRGGNVAIRRPRYSPGRPREAIQDACDIQGPVPRSVEEADSLDHVYADAMAFGMGQCCLQVTMQAKNVEESRHLYDQLAPLTPILLALTAASPFLRGWICDDDTRWGTISQSVDDRNAVERGAEKAQGSGDERLAGAGQRALRKSRYDSVDCYIGNEGARYNDIPLVFDEDLIQRLRDNGLDEALAQHVAHLFARDPLVMFGDRLELDDEVDIDHWENLQSTNWQTLRWKPPPPAKGALPSEAEKHIGWRVEFRSMEVQPTDFENAAFTSFVILLSRAILDLKLNLLVPMSKVEENMHRAERRMAATEEKFWFRTRVLPEDDGEGLPDEELFDELTVKEILLGKGDYPGLIPLCGRYLSHSDTDIDTGACMALREYLPFIIKRAEGTLQTPATFMRNFVLDHESYQHDCRVPAAAAHDLMLAMTEIGDGRRECPEIFGAQGTPRSTAAGSSDEEASPIGHFSAGCRGRGPCSEKCMASMNLACRC